MDKLKCVDPQKGAQERVFNPQELKGLMNQYAASEKAINAYAYKKTGVFSASNMVGEYAELLACQTLGLTKQVASKGKFDAERDGKTYQIKSRWINSFASGNGKNEFGEITDKVINEVNFLLLVVFKGDDFSDARIYEVPMGNVLKIREAYEQGKISNAIVSTKLRGGKHKCYFYEKAFEEAIQLGFMRKVS